MTLGISPVEARIAVADGVRTFKLWDYLGTDKIPRIDYLMKSETEEHKVNQPFRYNDITIIGEGQPKSDNFKVSEQYGGRIMSESVPSFHRSD